MAMCSEVKYRGLYEALKMLPMLMRQSVVYQEFHRDSRSTGTVADQLVETERGGSLVVTSGVVADPRDVQARDDVHAHGGDEETGVSAADMVHSNLNAVPDDDADESSCEERASELEAVAESADDQENHSGEDVDRDGQELGVDVAVSHASDNGRPEISGKDEAGGEDTHMKVDRP